MPTKINLMILGAGIVGAAVMLLSASGASANSQAKDLEPITVFAAASLADVMPKLADTWQLDGHGARVRVSVGASGVIARQIEAGASADLFISANQKWINYLIAGGYSGSNSKIVAQNRLVMALPCNDATKLSDLSAPGALKLLLESKRFAMADPKVSPAGDYTKIALEKLALWDAVEKNATYAGSVRLALLLTERGGLPGFVYATDAQKSALACTALHLPTTSYPTIKYVGMTPRDSQGSASKTAEDFLAWLTGAAAAVIWQTHGFWPTAPK